MVMPGKAYLRCKFSPGMFSDEALVELSLLGGSKCTFVVPRKEVLDDAGGKGRLHVSVFRRDNVVWAVLPTDYSASIAVEQEALVPA